MLLYDWNDLLFLTIFLLYCLEKIACSMCKETIEREIFDSHKGEICPKRIVTCEFCEFPLPAVDLAEHQVFALTCTHILPFLSNQMIFWSAHFSNIRKCVATGQNSVINATAMLDWEKDITMKPNALALCLTMLNHPGTFSYLHCFILETWELNLFSIWLNSYHGMDCTEGSREQQKEMETGEDEEMETVFRTKGFSSQ